MPTSNQIDELTTSTNGRNVQAKLQPKSHFFVEGAGFTQSGSQAFGASTLNTFRTTAKVSLTGSKDIYAICQGQLFVQPQTGSPTKVNVILKPFRQPINGIGIKYFIYRGLTKSDFVIGGELAASGTTGLTQFLWDQFESFYDNGVDPLPTFAEHFIGLPTALTTSTSQNGTDLVEQYFNKVTTVINPVTGEEDPNLMFELPVVPSGIHLSTVTGEIGLDVVLDNGEYYIENDPNPFKLDLTFARQADSVIDITSVTDPYQIKLYKEACTQFMDIAAFYGLHANGAGKLKMDDGALPPLTSATDIYAKLAGFHTKNNLYIYIQANRQRSYNFYDNYEHSSGNTNTLNIGGTETTMTETTFGTLGWPIHVFSETQAAGTSMNTLCMQLTTDGSLGASLYMKTGFLTSENEIGFVRGENLLETPPASPTAIVDTDYTKFVKSETPSEGANTIASLIEIVYEGKEILVEEYSAVTSPNPVMHLLKDIDDLFGLINAKSFKLPQTNDELTLTIDEKIQIVNFENEARSYDIGVVKHLKVEDKIQTVNEMTFLERVTYETLVDKIKQKVSPYFNSPTSNIDTATAGLGGANALEFTSYSPNSPFYLDSKSFTDSSTTVMGFMLKSEISEPITKKILGITKAENQLLKDLVSAENLSNPKIYFKDLLGGGDTNFVSIDNIDFKKFQLTIVAEDFTGSLSLYHPTSVIFVYTLDQYGFFSPDYSEYVSFDLEGQYYINLEI